MLLTVGVKTPRGGLGYISVVRALNILHMLSLELNLYFTFMFEFLIVYDTKDSLCF